MINKKIKINNKVLFVSLVVAVLFLSSCAELGPRTAAQNVNKEHNLALAKVHGEGVYFNCKNPNDIQFIYEGISSRQLKKLDYNCYNIDEIKENKKLTNEFFDEKVKKVFYTAARHQDSKLFKEGLQVYEEIADAFNLHSLFTHLAVNVGRDKMYSFDGYRSKIATSWSNDYLLEGCLSDAYLKITSPEGKITCLSKDGLNKIRGTKSFTDKLMDSKWKVEYGPNYKIRYYDGKLTIPADNPMEVTDFPYAEHEHMTQGGWGWGQGSCSPSDDDYCATISAACCVDNCIVAAGTLCQTYGELEPYCQSEAICGANIVYSSVGYGCGETGECDTTSLIMYDEFIVEDCGIKQACFYGNDITNEHPFCDGNAQNCEYVDGGVLQTGTSGIDKNGNSIIYRYLGEEIWDRYDPKIGSFIKVPEGSSSRDERVEPSCEQHITGTNSVNGQIRLKLSECKCASNAGEGDLPIYGWWHEMEDEIPSIFTSNTMGCEQELGQLCGPNDPALCYLTPVSSAIGDAGMTYLPWKINDQTTNGSFYLTADMLDYSLNTDAFNFGDYHGGTSAYKLWRAGPCSDGFGLFCVGDGYCETVDNSNNQENYHDGEYETYYNSPEDCEQSYVLSFQTGGISSPYGNDAVGQCDDAAGPDPPFTDIWGNIAYSTTNALTLENFVCPADMKKLYFTDYSNTYFFDEAGDIIGQASASVPEWIEIFNETCVDEGNVQRCNIALFQDDGVLAGINGVALGRMYGFNTYFGVKTLDRGLDDHCGVATHPSWGEYAHYNFKSIGVSFDNMSANLPGVECSSEFCNLRAVGWNMGFSQDTENVMYKINLNGGSWSGIEEIPSSFIPDGWFDFTTPVEDYQGLDVSEWLIDHSLENRGYCCMSNAQRAVLQQVGVCAGVLST